MMDSCTKSARDYSSLFDCILFDLDDTLYSKTGIGQACKRNIEEFLVQKCGFTEEKASSLRVELFKTYGSSLAGLRALGYDIDADDYHGDESELIKKIVEEVSSKVVKLTNLDVAAYPIGLESHVEHISCLLNDGCVLNDGPDLVRFLEIYGCGGIGKTTIAKAVFNLLSQKFEGSSILFNVREASSERNGLTSLQKQLLSDVLKKEHEDISNEDRGINIIKRLLCRKRVLIVLDDVDDMKQLDKLVGAHDWFGQGSRIIITTRDEHLLKMSDVDKKYKVELMTHNQSIQLFSFHAFRQDHPYEDYVGLSNDAVKYAGGLPIALAILGSLLYRKSQVDWKSELEKLRKKPNDLIFKIFEISYDALDDFEQKIFLYVSCFFIGQYKDNAITFLDAYGLSAKSGIGRLIERSLLTINEYNELCMHDLIRDMGREIIRRQSPWNLGGRSLLWHHEDVVDVLRNLTAADAVEGLQMKGMGVEKFQLDTNAFLKMPNLKLLRIDCPAFQVRGVDWEHCHEDQNIIFQNLVWLSWRRSFPLKCIPNNFYLGNLVILEIQGKDKLKEVWKGTKHLPKLKVLNLSGSYCLTCTPDLSGLLNLETLILKMCRRLLEVDKSIGNLTKLVDLDLSDCASLRILPSGISKLASLKKLDMSNCGELENLPDDLGNLFSLKSLDLSGNKFVSLPSTICQFSELETVILRSCSSLKTLPILPSSLHSLMAFGCSSLEKLPNLSNLKHLRKLDLSLCGKLYEIEGLEGLDSVETIQLDECVNLGSFAKKMLPSSFNSLEAYNCASLERLPNLSNLKHLRKLDLSRCKRLNKIEGLESLESLETIYLNGCDNLMSLAQGMLPSSSRSIEAPNCQWLKRLPNLSNLKHLMKLDLSRCPKLREIEGLEGLESVETIKLVFCDNLRSFADEMLPSSLRSLEVHNCISLERLPSLSNLKLLRKLDLSHCLKLNEIEGLEGLESVEAIKLYGCQNLRSFAEQMLPSTLVYLNVDHCQSLERLPNLSNLKHLKALNLSNCLMLNEIEGLQGLESIETITFNGADHLRSSINKKMYQAGNRHIDARLLTLAHVRSLLQVFVAIQSGENRAGSSGIEILRDQSRQGIQ